MTNAPIILTLDCDMYSSDPKTPSCALCYILDPKLRNNLCYVQFPKKFRGVSQNDIYAEELKNPFIINSGCFFVRRIFFESPSSFESPNLSKLSSNQINERCIQSPEVLELAHLVAGCDYENNTKWVSRVAFYGDVPINLLDVLNQIKRWSVGPLEVAFSKYSPITSGVRSMGFLMGFAYAHYAFWPIWSIPVTVYAFLPQLALINGTYIFPKVWDALFIVYMLLFLGAYGQNLVEFLLGGGTFGKWWNDQRMWSIRVVSSLLSGSMEFILKCLGINSSLSFNVTSKAIDEEQSKRYKQELFEFGVLSPMFVPIATAATVNLVGFIYGVMEIWRWGGAWEHVFAQMLAAGFGVVNCWPVYEAMALRNDEGKLPPKLTFLSLSLALLLCSFVHLFC
ncbi:unnamed protein product [Citrullus colocynthis]|uniref:Cellulose synthase-like protein G3 n=1 Tax=Citrullus colocynthis TaxID=252529 RepID=A0ABP0Z0J3_9ROSI